MSGSADRWLRLVLLLGCLSAARAADPSILAAEVDQTKVAEIVRVMGNFGPRQPGTTGGRAAAAVIEEAFHDYGLQSIQRQQFITPMPVTSAASLFVNGQSYDVAPLAPNFVRLSAVEPSDGTVVYAGQGELPKLAGLPLDQAIVLLDFDCGQRWLDIAMLGAKALVFVDTGRMSRGEAERKLLNVPLDVPRFYLSRDDFRTILGDATEPRVIGDGAIAGGAEWRAAESSNILGVLPGSDPELRRQCLVVCASYDSSTVIEGRGPGAEQAGGLAALLETARLLAADPPQRSVLFVALDAHAEALGGARQLAYVLRRAHTRDRWDKARMLMQREDQEHLDRLQDLLDQEGSDETRDARLSDADHQAYLQVLQLKVALAKQDMALADFVNEQFDELLVIALDLSSGSRQLGVFHTGHFYRNDKLTRFLSPLGKRLAESASQAGFGEVVKDCITPAQDRAWDSWVPDQFATDAEPFTEAGRPAISLFTIGDSRPTVATPFDTPDRVRLPDLMIQIRAAVATVASAANDPELITQGLKRLRRMEYRYQPVDGMVYEFERRKTFLPNTPVPNALVALKNPANSMMGVRPDIFTLADPRGDFRILGYPDDAALKIDAYGFAAGTGDIVYAPDLGPEGETKYPREVKGRQGLRRPLLTFPCAALNLFDLVDERYFETLQQIYVYDAETDSEPRSYGYELPIHSPPAKVAGTVSASYVEPVAVVYAPRNKAVKVTMGMGLLGLRFILINSTPNDPEGSGFNPSIRRSVPRTSFQAAHDMWQIDDWRIRQQKTFGISSLRLDNLHGKAGSFLKQAEQALTERQWADFVAAARAAWAYEARAYPDVQGTEADTIKGVLFYLALLLPFAFFGERLLFASPTIKFQIVWTVVIFMIIYVCLRYIHPAFQLLDTPWIILLGFIIMTLASVVIAIVAQRFNEELESLKQAAGGQHTADVSRLSTLGAAFSLGISNMRRRPMRSAMTAVTLILLTFTVLSFTSVRSSLRANAQPTPNAPVYPGLMIRDPVWSALESPTASIFENQFRDDGLVAPRAWLSSAQLDKQLKLSVANGTAGMLRERLRDLQQQPEPPAEAVAASERLLSAWPAGEPASMVINAVLGVTAQEPKITGLGTRLAAGRWFTPGEQDVCVIPMSVAETLDLGPGSTADHAGLGYGALEVFGSRLKVVGVIDDDRLGEVHDLDGEPLTPVDFSALAPEKLRMLTEQQAQKLKLGSSPPPPIDRYEHFPAGMVVILPYDRLMTLGGTLRSVAIRFTDPEAVAPAARELMDRFELSAYAGQGDEVRLYSSVGMTSVGGLSTVIIPLLIAALIVLNTMLGAVAERLTEIGIFSSLGLAPAHIAMLFVAESCVFANVGVILGYLGGQTIAKLLFVAQQHGAMDSLAGLSLNYSSTSTVGVAIVIITTVLLSTIYPAKKASQMATPDIERRWRLPIPDGHLMSFALPFMLTGKDALACVVFLKEYFDGYVDFAGGDFYTDGTELKPHTDGGFALSLRVWLAPYDLGVSQIVRLVTHPDPDDPIVSTVQIELERISGDDNGWRRTNWLFINILRQQFLIWRTIPRPQREAYAERGLELIGSEPVEGT